QAQGERGEAILTLKGSEAFAARLRFRAPRIANDDLDDDIVALQEPGLFFPETIGLALAIQAQSASAGREFVDAATDFIVDDRPLAKLDAPVDPGEIGDIIGD